MANDKIDKADSAREHEPGTASRRRPERVRVIILAGVIVLIAISALNLYETVRQRTEFTDRMTQVLNAVNTRPTPNPADSPRPPGPDPDKVYTVKTQGAPARGPNRAPVRIAEFSDFQ